MANRAYLYGIKGKKVSGISEYNYDIPISYKILLSQNTKRVKSKIFRSPFKIALQGDFEKGVEKLNEFLEELMKKGYFDENELEKEIENTKAFFGKNTNFQYFYLDCSEIYEMESKSRPLSNKRMSKQILNINHEIERFYQEMDAMKKEYDDMNGKMTQLQKETGGNKKLEELKNRMMGMIGIQEWTNYLYYELGE